MPRDGGTHTMSMDHNVFLYFLINHEKVNLPRYMFNYMCWAIKESCGLRRQDKYQMEESYQKFSIKVDNSMHSSPHV